MKNVIMKVDHISEKFEILSAEQALDEIVFNDLELEPIIFSTIFDGFVKYETNEGDIVYEVFRGNYAYQFEEVEKRIKTLEECGYLDMAE